MPAVVLLGAAATTSMRAPRSWSACARRGTMAEIQQKLDPEKLLRVNRSEIIRLDAVAELQPWFHGDYRVKMKDGTVPAWSRRYRARSKLGW